MSQPLVVITGASSGIGRACAEKFSQAGHPLLLLARRVEKLEELNLPNTVVAKADVTDLDKVLTAVHMAEQKFGPVDCIVNNAGTSMLGDLWNQDPKEWDVMIDTNIKGVLNSIRAVVNSMRENKHGTIFTIGSVAGINNIPKHEVYCASKSAVHAISEGLRQDLAESNIRCSIVAPGLVETDIFKHTTDDSIKQQFTKEREKVTQVIQPQELADIILHAYQLPQHICMRNIVVAPTEQKF